MSPKPSEIPSIEVPLATAVTVTTAATQLVAFSKNRREVVLFNNGANTIFVGATGVTLAAGFPVQAGGALTYDGNGALFGIVAAATEEMRLFENIAG